MMTELTALWLPILLAAVLCHVASFILWAGSKWHKNDMRVMPNQDAAGEAISGLSLAPGHYLMPCTYDKEEYASEAYKKRMENGPWAVLTIMPRNPNMLKNILLTLLVFFVVSILIAYLGASVMAPGTEYMKVFQVTATGALLAYTFGGMANGIWFGKQRAWVIRDIIDALIYTGITAGMFAWLWPSLSTAVPAVP